MNDTIKVEIDKKLEKILKNREIKRIYRESAAPYVYETVKNLVSRNVEDWYERWVITRRVFLDYLKKSNAFNRKKNNKENTLMFMMSYIDDDALKYLLTDVNYDFTNEDGLVLLDELALNVQYPDIMNIIINEVDDNRLYFGNVKRKEYTDLCTMNVIAGNLDKALDVFNKEEFKILTNYDGDIERNDCLYRIVKNLVNLKEEKEVKISFLDNILYSKKVEVLNIDILNLIRGMCSEDKLKEYKSYFNNKKNIILYHSSLENKNEILSEKNKVKRK